MEHKFKVGDKLTHKQDCTVLWIIKMCDKGNYILDFYCKDEPKYNRFNFRLEFRDFESFARLLTPLEELL